MYRDETYFIHKRMEKLKMKNGMATSLGIGPIRTSLVTDSLFACLTSMMSFIAFLYFSLDLEWTPDAMLFRKSAECWKNKEIKEEKKHEFKFYL